MNILNIDNLTERILESFLDSYAEIKTTQLDTDAVFNEGESTFCRDLIRRRWDVSVERHGQRLSQCLRFTVLTLNQMTRTLNSDHAASQSFSNGLQGVAINEISHVQNFADDRDIPRSINFAFRDRMLQSLANQQEFDAFRDDLIHYQDDYVFQLTRCESGVVRSLHYEAIEWLRQAEDCYNEGEQKGDITKKIFRVPKM